MTRHVTVTKAGTAREALARQLDKLATARLEAWRKDFACKFPRQHGSITFGMGTERVEIGGKQWNTWDGDPHGKYHRATAALRAAIEDVWTITGDYRDACPDDFTF